MNKKNIYSTSVSVLAGASILASSFAPASAMSQAYIPVEPSPLSTVGTSAYTQNIGENNVFVQSSSDTQNVEHSQVVLPDNIADNQDLSLVQKTVLAHAYDGIGGNYVWGGKTYKNWDCSGFVSYVFKQAHIDLTPYTYAMVNELEKTDTPQPGDIVFQNNFSHVGIYIGDGKMINALNPSQGTMITAVDGGGLMSVDGYYKVPQDVLAQAEESLAQTATTVSTSPEAVDANYGEFVTQ